MEARSSRLHATAESPSSCPGRASTFTQQEASSGQHAAEHDALPGSALNTSSAINNTDEAIADSGSHPVASAQGRKVSEAGLHIQTNDPSAPSISAPSENFALPAATQIDDVEPAQLLGQPQRPPMATRRSFETVMSAYSPASSISSPVLNALHDITPLPSPVFSSESHATWQRLTGRVRASSSASIARDEAAGIIPPVIQFSPPSSKKKKKKTYQNLTSTPLDFSLLNDGETSDANTRNRSLSEYVPEHLQNVRPRNFTAPGLALHPESNLDQSLHREEYLARQRGLSVSNNQEAARTLPSPPRSNISITDSDEGEEHRRVGRISANLLEAQTFPEGIRKRWSTIRRLGEGSFSHVVLAVDEEAAAESPVQESKFDLKQLVAIKIVSHGPAAGPDEERMETSIKREIDVLQSIDHPSLPHMLAFEDNSTQALLVLSYCPGGDLFEVASQHKDLITPAIVQRLFAELVGAVNYLHKNLIVHRDIKLENVLLNVPILEIAKLSDARRYSTSLVTLADLGLSRRIPQPPASALLHHQCGSVDYTAPEILLGQPYDGRSTDGWALGVLLYALIEARLPFDTLPGKRPTSVKHRIARCDWLWCTFGDEDGEWIENNFKARGLDGARELVEGLLKKVSRGRWTLDMVSEHEWVKNGVQVEGGL